MHVRFLEVSMHFHTHKLVGLTWSHAPHVEKNAYGIATSRSVGLRVAEVAKFIKLGMERSAETEAI